ncbi:DNA methyltransferase [Nitrosomonas communis]|uniref:DNA methyltransferase n=1 Tax=Nitrosomonas communis TaxID=44574 RepID=UPI003D295EF7
MQNLLNDLTLLLEQDDRLVAEGMLLKNKVVELGLALDPDLIKLLLKHEAIKKHFFVEFADVMVFDKIKFQRFVSNKQFLPDSYTAFKNKIGLTAEEEYLTECKEVVLAWPYKDCVLEGGQDKEDAKRGEVFWNEVLAPDQIDRLLSPKVLTNFRRYDKKGKHPVTELSLNDNYIIKGNNLLALHTLKKVFATKVKLIYIDPPYNTGNDSFKYNDRFNHSSWLTFMKNRLEVAKEFLAPNGTIWITIDEGEAHYLKVLCDQIFTRDCFVSALAWRSADSSNNDAKRFSVDHNEILVYSKNPGWLTKRLPRTEESNAHYSNPDNDPKGAWFSGNVSSPNPRENLKYDIISPNGKKIRPPNNGWRWSKEKVKEFIESGEIVFSEDETRIIKKTYLANQKGIAPSSIWDDYEDTGHNRQAKYELMKLFPDTPTAELFRTPKPERLLKRILEIGTDEEDLVLDFFMGAATTCAVALKMNRGFIGIEQMDYIESVSVQRINKVIAGESGGISDAVNWKGGGNFVYCELSLANQTFIDMIQNAKTNTDLQTIWQAMQERAFLSYKIDPKVFDENIDEFEALSFKDQQHFLIEVLDKNMLYVPYSEIDDATNVIDDVFRALNHQFFSLK